MVSKLPELMKEHEGKEEQYLNDLIARHGPEPRVAHDTKPRFDHPKTATARQKKII